MHVSAQWCISYLLWVTTLLLKKNFFSNNGIMSLKTLNFYFSLMDLVLIGPINLVLIGPTYDMKSYHTVWNIWTENEMYVGVVGWLDLFCMLKSWMSLKFRISEVQGIFWSFCQFEVDLQSSTYQVWTKRDIFSVTGWIFKPCLIGGFRICTWFWSIRPFW